MSHPNDDTRSSASAAAGKPTLEALLRLKRVEKPDALFWEQFDHRLRQKQLAAIIEPRPWWLGFALLSRRLAPAGLPISAVAAALVAIMALRTEAPFAGAPAPVKFASVAHVSTPPALVAEVRATAPLSSAVHDNNSSDASVPARSGSVLSAPASVPAAPVRLAEAGGAVARAGAGAPMPVAADASVVEVLLEIAATPAAPTASERTIEENLAAIRAEQPEFASATLPLSAQDGAVAVEADASAPALKMEVRNPRHARVLLAMADNPTVETTGGIGHLRDGLARSLVNEDSLAGSASRLGVGGDRFSVSF